MKMTRSLLSAFVLVLGVVQGGMAQMGQSKGSDIQELWLRLERELGLQKSYSVEMVAQVMGMTVNSKIYRSNERSRSDLTMPMVNIKMAALQLPESGKMVNYMLFPDNKQYCLAPDDGSKDEKITFTKQALGSEQYEGVTCQKQRVTLRKAGHEDQVFDILFSPTHKSMPVKMTAQVVMPTERGGQAKKSNLEVLFRNYNFNAPAAALFKIPADYTQVASMQEAMMGSLFGTGGKAGGDTKPAGGLTVTPEMLRALRNMQQK